MDDGADSVVGDTDGAEVGDFVGKTLGINDGKLVGDVVGLMVGIVDGFAAGDDVGIFEGCDDGVTVGMSDCRIGRPDGCIVRYVGASVGIPTGTVTGLDAG